MDVQRNLEANFEKRTKDTYGPPMGKKLLVFMDDMNMPQVNNFFIRSILSVIYRICSIGKFKLPIMQQDAPIQLFYVNEVTESNQLFQAFF